MNSPDSNNAIEHAIKEWDGVNAGPAHGVLVRAARELLERRSLSAEDRVTVEWLKQLLGSIAYRVEPRRAPAVEFLNRLLGVRS